jgi:hypothetical protein
MTCDISISGNSIFIDNQQSWGGGYFVDHIIVPSNSGGVQLPDVPVLGLSFEQWAEKQSGGSVYSSVLVGGSGNSAPYHDSTIFPPLNGHRIDVFSPLMVPVKNANVFRVVAMSGNSGVSLGFYGVTPPA